MALLVMKLFFEAKQFYIQGKKYILDFWNLIDFVSIILVITTLIIDLNNTEYSLRMRVSSTNYRS